MIREERLISVENLEVRQTESGLNQLVGYAAKFYNPEDRGTQYSLGPDIVERIAPSAFERAIREQQDVVGLFDHGGLPLGRTSAGTMRLRTDDFGLRYEIDLPDTQEAKSIRELVSRGDLRGSSFGFIATGEDWSVEGGKEVRTLKDVDLKDVGPVSMPAYDSTTVSTRNRENSQEALRMATYAIESRYQDEQRRIAELRERLNTATEERKKLEAEIEKADQKTECLSIDSGMDRFRMVRLRQIEAECTRKF